MKRIVLLLLIIELCLTMKAQCNLPYKSLSNFDNDTIAFFKYNFSDRATCYVGKTMNNANQE
jgi:hypothetical protein